MTATYNFGLHILATLPPWLAAFLVGWAFSVGVTHSIKFTLPVRWCQDTREIIARVTAVLSAALPAGLYYAGQPDAQPGPLALVMFGTGIWSPLAFALLMGGLRRWPRGEWIADVLSGDKRGVLKAKFGGAP